MVIPVLLAVALAVSGHPSHAAREMLPCRFDIDALADRDCAWKDRGGRLHISPDHLRRADFDKFGLAAVLVDRFYYVRRDGRSVPTMALDNWAEPFSAGRARSPVNGKIGYIDRRLKLVVPAKYDGAYTFDHGIAVVCIGCKSASDGEHSWYEGGVWGCIDRYGREQSPFRALKPRETNDANCPKGRFPPFSAR